MPTCPRLGTQRLASACIEDKTNTLHAATTANKSRFRFICHPRIVFDQHAAYPPSIGSRLPRSMSTATFNGASVLHPGGSLRRRIPSDKPTLYGSPLCRVTIEVPNLSGREAVSALSSSNACDVAPLPSWATRRSRVEARPSSLRQPVLDIL